MLAPQVVVNLLPEFGVGADFLLRLRDWPMLDVHFYCPPFLPNSRLLRKRAIRKLRIAAHYLAPVANSLVGPGSQSYGEPAPISRSQDVRDFAFACFSRQSRRVTGKAHHSLL